MKKFLLALVLSLAAVSGSFAQASPPVITPAAGPYQNSLTVTITEALSGYNIYYTTDGTTPTAASTLYTGPFVVNKSETVKAIAIMNPSSPVASIQYIVIPCLTSVLNSWTVHEPIAVGTTFQVVFDVIPNVAKMDGVVGLSNGVAGAYTSLAPVVRFNNLGFIDAMNGASFYQSLASIPYTPGTSYHFVMNVNTTTKTYGVLVNGIALATNYAFRPGAIAAPLDTLNAFSEVGTLQACNIVATNTTTPPPPAMHTVGLSWDPEPTALAFNVYRSTTSGGPYSQIASGVTLDSFIDSNVSNGGTYYYVITATDATTESGFSTQVTLTIPLLRRVTKKRKVSFIYRKEQDGNQTAN